MDVRVCVLVWLRVLKKISINIYRVVFWCMIYETAKMVTRAVRTVTRRCVTGFTICTKSNRQTHKGHTPQRNYMSHQFTHLTGQHFYPSSATVIVV